MSKIKKTPAGRTTTISEKDIKFVKIIEFCGWSFLFIFAAFLAYWGLFDYVLNKVDLELDAITYSYIIFTGISGTICFGLATKINKDFEQKKSYFIDWLISQFLLNVFALIAIAVYQW